MTTQKSESVIFAMKIHWNIFRPLLPLLVDVKKCFFYWILWLMCVCCASEWERGQWQHLKCGYLFIRMLSTHIIFPPSMRTNLCMLSLQWSHSRDYSNNKCCAIRKYVMFDGCTVTSKYIFPLALFLRFDCEDLTHTERYLRYDKSV
jgi:hypothetical protein